MKIPTQIAVSLNVGDNCEEIREWLEKVNAAAHTLNELLANPPDPRITVSIGEPYPVQEE